MVMAVDTDLEFTMDLASYVYPEGENWHSSDFVV